MKKCGILLSMILLLMTGCRQKDDSIVISDESASYAEETWDVGITPEYQPMATSFLLIENMLCFVDKTEGSPQRVCTLSLQNKEQPVRQILQLESGQIEAMETKQGVDGELTIAVIGKDNTGTPFLEEYTGDGQLLWHQSYTDQLAEQEQIVFRLVRDNTGCYYAMGMGGIWLFDPAGYYQGDIVCPGKSYVDLCLNDEGTVYATYQDDQSNRCVLAQVRFQEQNLTEEMKMAFSGFMWMGKNGSILMRDNNTIYAYMPQQKQAVKLLNLLDYNLTGKQIAEMRETETGDILLVTEEKTDNSSSIWINRLYVPQNGEETVKDKQMITLLLPDIVLEQDQAMGAGEFSAIAAEFNRQSEEYTVILEGISLEDSSDVYAAINTRLLAKESADLLYLLDYRDVERYMTKGYLEDLIPYIEQSENIRREEYLETVLQCYTVNGSLYSIPTSFSMDTLGGKISEMGIEPGWTIEEFLDWLEQHPDAQAEEGLPKINILTYCLMGGMEGYVDLVSHRSDFTGESFRKLLERIQLLQVGSDEHWDDWIQVISAGECSVLDRYDVYSFLQCNDREDAYGEALVYKGYPSGDGAPCYFYSAAGISILSRSSWKEGAYAFWEYYLMHHTITPDAYYTNKSLLNDSMTYASEIQYTYDEQGRKVTRHQENAMTDPEENTEMWIPYMNEEQCNKQLAMMEYVRVDTLENQTIRSIILEEAQYYFQGIKGLEETCEIIQNRVQIYLDETKS